MKRHQTVAGVVLLLTTMTGIATVRGAQRSSQPSQPSQPVSAYGDMVFVNAGVTDAKKDFVHGVRREQFQVFEDGVEQRVAYFSEKGPWNVELVVGVDVLRLKKADRESIGIHEALDTFRASFGPNDQVHTDELPFGSNGLYDAIYKAITKVSQVANPRKAVVVVADGFDSVGGDPGAQLVEFARKYNVPVFSVFFREDARNASGVAIDTLANGNRTDASAGNYFRQVADITGGQYLSVESLGSESPGDTTLGRTLKDLANELKNQYVLGYMSTNDAKDNKYRKLKVTARPLPDGTKLTVTAKVEYFVPKSKT